jgi:phosphoglycolate phosphatase-like HAD superfamily hydrolase
VNQICGKRRERNVACARAPRPLTKAVHPRRLIIFDVDGTLIDAHPVDNDTFEEAFREITGRPLTTELWETFTEVTAVAILHQALGHDWPDLASMEISVRESYLSRLKTAHELDAMSIQPFAGALDLFTGLGRHDRFAVAIATGCWRETAHFKLTATGFPFTAKAFACASDRHRRADIIRLAAERAGVPIEHAIYVGDGEWDLRAARELGIPFIGVGKRIANLRRAGARYTLERLDLASLEAVINQIDEAATPAS